jgi:hypothetical protein
MPDPFSMLALTAAAKVLASGQPLTPEAWMSAAGSILEKLLDRQSDTAQTLNRIEEKLDKQLQQLFTVAFGAGREHLGKAQRAIDRARKGEDRQANLDDARADLVKAQDKFIEALQVTGTQDEPELARAMVHWHLALVYLMIGSRSSRSECVGSLRQALEVVEPLARFDPQTVWNLLDGQPLSTRDLFTRDPFKRGSFEKKLAQLDADRARRDQADDFRFRIRALLSDLGELNDPWSADEILRSYGADPRTYLERADIDTRPGPSDAARAEEILRSYGVSAEEFRRKYLD